MRWAAPVAATRASRWQLITAPSSEPHPSLPCTRSGGRHRLAAQLKAAHPALQATNPPFLPLFSSPGAVAGGTGSLPNLRVAHIACEMAPIAKAGGLGDVVTALGRAVQVRGWAGGRAGGRVGGWVGGWAGGWVGGSWVRGWAGGHTGKSYFGLCSAPYSTLQKLCSVLYPSEGWGCGVAEGASERGRACRAGQEEALDPAFIFHRAGRAAAPSGCFLTGVSVRFSAYSPKIFPLIRGIFPPAGGGPRGGGGDAQVRLHRLLPGPGENRIRFWIQVPDSELDS